MFGRYKDDENEPGWREKLAEWRDSPPVVLERPDWMTENLGTLALLFVGIAMLLFTIVYVTIPPESLPSSLPGYFSIAKADAEFAKLPKPAPTTTSTTRPDAEQRLQARLQRLNQKQAGTFWAWVNAVNAFNKKEAQAVAIVSTPRRPPTRRWDNAFVAGCAAVVLLLAAWFVSDTRSRRMWHS